MKNALAAIFAVALLITVSGVAAAAQPVRVELNGVEVMFDQPPIVQNNRNLVPLRAIFEAMGASVDWEEETQTVTALRKYTQVTMQVGNPVITVSGKEVALDVAPQTVNNRTLVPVRAVAESFRADVQWDEAAQTVRIQTKQHEIPFGADGINTDLQHVIMKTPAELSKTLGVITVLEKGENGAADVISFENCPAEFQVDHWSTGDVIVGMSCAFEEFTNLEQGTQTIEQLLGKLSLEVIRLYEDGSGVRCAIGDSELGDALMLFLDLKDDRVVPGCRVDIWLPGGGM